MCSLRLFKLRGGGWSLRLTLASLACSLGLWAAAPSATEDAVANGDTRTLHFYHTHTGETIDATYRVDGHYDAAVLRQLNHFLRDWRNNDEIAMDPRLFDAVWEAYRTAGATDRIQIYSAYRSPETNAMLRRRSRAVAEHSQHMLGKAMDTTLPGFPMERIRDAGMKLQNGGVGWYPSANFVHLDVGGVRSWPRMPYDQLARLFPDGKTVHIPANGQPMARYEEARAEIAARGGAELPPSQESGGFFAWLFGTGNTASTASEDEEDRRAVVPVRAPAPTRVEVARAPAPPAPTPAAQQVVALAYSEPSQAREPMPREPEVRAQAATTQAPAPQEANGGVTDDAAATGARDAASSGESTPLPPRRPAFLATVAEIPLPPVRPDALSRLASATDDDIGLRPRQNRDAIATLIATTTSGLPVIRRSSLPAIITQGTGSRRGLPPTVLAFAAPEPAKADLVRAVKPDLRPMAPASRPAPPRGVAALRGHARQPIVEAQAGEGLAPEPAPRVIGLRRAARSLAVKASL